MSVKIRLSRGGAKNRPYYTIVATDSRAKRDGSYIEKLGSYDPALPKDSAERFKIKKERIEYWLSKGAIPSELVARQLVKLGIIKEDKKVTALREKAIKRRAEEAKKAAEAKAAEEAAAAAPAPEAPAA